MHKSGESPTISGRRRYLAFAVVAALLFTYRDRTICCDGISSAPNPGSCITSESGLGSPGPDESSTSTKRTTKEKNARGSTLACLNCRSKKIKVPSFPKGTSATRPMTLQCLYKADECKTCKKLGVPCLDPNEDERKTFLTVTRLWRVSDAKNTAGHDRKVISGSFLDVSHPWRKPSKQPRAD